MKEKYFEAAFWAQFVISTLEKYGIRVDRDIQDIRDKYFTLYLNC